MSISIVIPVYNVEDYLHDCIDSILSQRDSDYEIILVDDGSTDDSGKICDDYASRYAQIHVVHQPNGGLSCARNTGIKHAQGDYVFFVDSDDKLLHDSDLHDIINILNSQNPDVLYLLTEEYNADFSQSIITHPDYPFVSDVKCEAHDILNRLYDIGGICVTMAQTKIIRRDFLLKNNLYFTNNIYHEDDEWIARLLLCNPSISFLSKNIYGYRHRDNSIISTTDTEKTVKKAKDRMDIAQKVLNNTSAAQLPVMMDYFVNYFLGGYSLILKINSSNIINFNIPYKAFLFSTNYKIKTLALLKYSIGTRLANKLLNYYLQRLN